MNESRIQGGQPKKNPSLKIGELKIVSYRKATKNSTAIATLSYSTENIGDDIQSYAVRLLVPNAPVSVDRDRIADAQFADWRTVVLIMNGWYTHEPGGLIPAPNVIPVLTSMHISQRPLRHDPSITPADLMLTGRNLDFLHENEPIGARDLSTLKLLEESDIRSYFSGCVTLTLQNGNRSPRGTKVLCVDAPSSVIDLLAARGEDLDIETQYVPVDATADQRATRTFELLEKMQLAKCVVSPRLHTCLPSLALEAPTILIDAALDQERFSGLNDLIIHLTADEFSARVHRNDNDKWIPDAQFRHVDLARHLKEHLLEISSLAAMSASGQIGPEELRAGISAAAETQWNGYLKSRKQDNAVEGGDSKSGGALLTESNIANLVSRDAFFWGAAASDTYHEQAQRDMLRQWDNVIFPVLNLFNIDYSETLDFAAGYGRNTDMLLRFAQRVTAVDVNPDCVAKLKSRFLGENVSVVQNNGYDLRELTDNKFSFIYSFDDMVHFDVRIVASYLEEFYRVANVGAFCFIHHSNYSESPGADFRKNPHWRNYMSIDLFRHFATRSGFDVIFQKALDWGDSVGIDGLTVLRKSR